MHARVEYGADLPAGGAGVVAVATFSPLDRGPTGPAVPGVLPAWRRRVGAPAPSGPAWPGCGSRARPPPAHATPHASDLLLQQPRNLSSVAIVCANPFGVRFPCSPSFSCRRSAVPPLSVAGSRGKLRGSPSVVRGELALGAGRAGLRRLRSADPPRRPTRQPTSRRGPAPQEGSIVLDKDAIAEGTKERCAKDS